MVIFWFFFIDNWFYCKYIPHLSQIYLADSAWVSFRDYPFDYGFKSKHWEFQIALFYLVLNPIFLDLDRTLIQDVTSAFTTVSLVLGTCMEQCIEFLICFFTEAIYVIFKREFWVQIVLILHSCFSDALALLSILTLTTSFPEKRIWHFLRLICV